VSILQLLEADCGQVERLVGDAVAQLSAALAASAVTPLDRCQLMEQMNDPHSAQLLPRARAAGAALAALAQHCLECKARPAHARLPASPAPRPPTSRARLPGPARPLQLCARRAVRARAPPVISVV